MLYYMIISVIFVKQIKNDREKLKLLNFYRAINRQRPILSTLFWLHKTPLKIKSKNCNIKRNTPLYVNIQLAYVEKISIDLCLWSAA